MSKKNLFSLLLVVAVLVLMGLACEGTGGGTLVIDQGKVADTIVDGLETAGQTVKDGMEALSDTTPGSGCLTYDLYETVTGKDVVDQSICK